jgi:hypothetical protein
MDAESPQRAGQRSRDGRAARRARWFAGVGVGAGVATVVALALGDLSGRHAIMLGLPAVVLTFGGLIVAALSDPLRAERQGFRAGLKAGTLRRRWRSVFDRQRKGRD